MELHSVDLEDPRLELVAEEFLECPPVKTEDLNTEIKKTINTIIQANLSVL